MALFFLLPPLITGNFLFRDYLEGRLTEVTGLRAEIQSISVSSWSGRFRISIPALDFFEPGENGRPVTTLDNVRCEMYPWQIISPLFGLQNGTVRDLQICSSGKQLRALLARFPYMDLDALPVWEDESRDASLRRINFQIKRREGGLGFSLRTDVECPALNDAFFLTDGLFVPGSGRLELESLLFQGLRHTVRRAVKDGRIAEVVTDIPFSLSCDAVLGRDLALLRNISFEADRLRLEGSLDMKGEDLRFDLESRGDFTEKLAALCSLDRRVSRFNSLKGRVEGKGDAGKRLLLTEGRLAFKDGFMLGVALTNAALTFSARNDHLTALDMQTGFWQGKALVKALESRTGDGQRLLKADFKLENLAMASLLEHFRYKVKMPQGRLSLDTELYLTNGTLSAFLSQGEETLSRLYGTGSVKAENVNLAGFTGADFQEGEVPLLLRRILGTGATIAAAKEEVPFLQQIMQALEKEKLRNYSASFNIREGAIRTPATVLSGNIGEVLASGECSLTGDISYKISLKLNEKLSEHYAKQPLASMFMQGRNITIPIKLGGDLARPKATLDLTEEQRAEFEERTLKLVTDFYQDKIKSTAARFLDKEEMGDVMQRIESSVKDLLKKLL